MKIKDIIPIVLTVIIIVGLSSCEKNNPGDELCDPTLKFNIDLFVQNIIDNVDDVAGYQLVVNHGGNLHYSGAEGFSVYGVDPGGAISMTEDIRMNVASVSKFIGTIALMQVLEKHNISIEEPIHNWLPDRWKRLMHPDHFDAGSDYLIRFRNMLRMETGIAFSGANWSPGIMPTTQQMLDAIQLPAVPNRWGIYQNGNFTLIRVLIGEIEYGLDANATNYNDVCADKYFQHIKENIFDKLDLDPPMSVDEVNDYYDGDFTRAHQWPFDETFRDGQNQLGWAATSDPTLNGGSGGLVLSSMDLAKVLAFFMHDEQKTIISADQRLKIIENELGLTETTSGEHGKYQSKGGTRGPENGTSRAIRSRIMIFPNGIEAVILTNSNITSLGTLLRTSYDDAWVSDCN